MSPLAQLAVNLRYLRLRANLTQEQMAELVDFEFKFYQRLEGGRKGQIKVETVERLGRPFMLDVWQLMAPTRILKKVRIKIPKARSAAARGPRAHWRAGRPQ